LKRLIEVDSKTLNFKTLNSETLNSETLDSETVDSEMLDPETLNPETLDWEKVVDENNNGSGFRRSGRLSKHNINNTESSIQENSKKRRREIKGNVRGGVSLSKHQWEAREQLKAPKVSIKDDIHDIIGWLASTGILEAAQENAQKMFNTLTVSAPTQESISTLNHCAQALQKNDKANFDLNFKSIILLIEAARINRRYVH